MIENIGTEKDESLSFTGVGKLMNTLGIYKVLYEKEDVIHSSTYTLSKREFKEKEFQENLWKLITERTGNCNTHQLVEVLVVLHDASMSPAKVLSSEIQGIIFCQ